MAWKPIVVGVDASPAAATAAVFAERLARLASVECRLVHAAGSRWMAQPPSDLVQVVDVVRLASLAVARSEVEQALSGVLSWAALDRMLVRPGRAVAVLRDVVAELGAGLVVLGGKHHSLLARWTGGSTAHNAVRTLPVPILVTGHRAPGARPRVLVALDRSHAARRTVAAAEGMVRLLGGQLRALHVLEPLPVLPETVPTHDLGAFEALQVEEVTRNIWPLVRLPGTDTALRHGHPAEAIAAEAATWGADLVVVGSHGKGWVDRVLLGSVTERLLAALPASVLVVPIGQPRAAGRRLDAARATRPQTEAATH